MISYFSNMSSAQEKSHSRVSPEVELSSRASVGWYFLQTSPGVPSHPAWFSLTFKGSNSTLPTYGCCWAQRPVSGAHTHSNRFIRTSPLRGRAFISQPWCLIKSGRCKARKSSKNRENTAQPTLFIFMKLPWWLWCTWSQRHLSPSSLRPLQGCCRTLCRLHILQLVLSFNLLPFFHV